MIQQPMMILDGPTCSSGIANSETRQIWENDWIASDTLKQSLNVSSDMAAAANAEDEVVQPEEVELFNKNALAS